VDERFHIRRAEVHGVDMAFVQEGEGGFPLLLLHGWPETKRIWWRNVEFLAGAGFEVIVPDLRGFGDSGLAPDGFYDVAASSRDVHALVHDMLGHERCVTSGGDFGSVVAQDLSLRFEGFVVRQVLFNAVMPVMPEAYAEAGIPAELPRETRMASDYFIRQATDADGLAAELDTPEKRRAWVAGMYGHRFWAAPGSFTREDVEFMTEPFGDADSFRASIALYEYWARRREWSERPRFMERNPTPTLVLYGPADHVLPRTSVRQAEVAFPELVGPFIVEGAGHFLQWEKADVLNRAIKYFCLDLLGTSAGR
jgi:pimeloyl-ACP methyl ester carboxylesterase